MKYIIIQLSIIIIGIIIIVKGQRKCEDNSKKSECTTDPECSWVEDASKDVCKNIFSDCKLLSIQKEICEANISCQFLSGREGFCNQKTSLGCPQTKQECENDQNKNRCFWTSTQECENKQDNEFKCSQFKTEDKCYENYNFCVAKYFCKDIDSQKCKILSKQECQDASEYCIYQEKSKEQCTKKEGFCDQLESEQCELNTKFCQFKQQIPFTCTDKDDPTICSFKSPEECVKSSDYCTQIQKPCIFKRNVNCSSFLNEDECFDPICFFNQDTQKCELKVDCPSLDDQSCSDEFSSCIKIMNECKNNDSFNCSSRSNLECKQNSEYCTYTHAKGTCVSLEEDSCKNLSGYDCQQYYNECNYKPVDGECNIKDSLNCDKKNRLDCLDFPYCIATFESCQDIEGDVCSIMSSNDCKQASSKCKESEEGYCSDAIIECPNNEIDCQENQDCHWIGEIKDFCIQNIDCSNKNSFECNQSQNICNYTPGGSCIPIKQFIQDSSNRLFFSSFL